jgi:hypothetical protein
VRPRTAGAGAVTLTAQDPPAEEPHLRLARRPRQRAGAPREVLTSGGAVPTYQAKALRLEHHERSLAAIPGIGSVVSGMVAVIWVAVPPVIREKCFMG